MGIAPEQETEIEAAGLAQTRPRLPEGYGFLGEVAQLRLPKSTPEGKGRQVLVSAEASGSEVKLEAWNRRHRT